MKYSHSGAQTSPSPRSVTAHSACASSPRLFLWLWLFWTVRGREASQLLAVRFQLIRFACTGISFLFTTKGGACCLHALRCVYPRVHGRSFGRRECCCSRLCTRFRANTCLCALVAHCGVQLQGQMSFGFLAFPCDFQGWLFCVCRKGRWRFPGMVAMLQTAWGVALTVLRLILHERGAASYLFRSFISLGNIL